MPRTLSAVARAALYAQETGEVPVHLLTIQTGETGAVQVYAPGIYATGVYEEGAAGQVPTVYRVCDSFTPVTSRGYLFSPFPFSIVLPEEGEEGAMRATLVVDNIGRELTAWLRELPNYPPPTCRIEIVLASQPDVVERAFPRLMFGSPVVEAATITVELTDYDISQEPFSLLSFTPSGFPGLFK